jgi:hypothetical protein
MVGTRTGVLHVYGVGPRGHRCILVTAVTVMTPVTLIYGLILDKGTHLYFVGSLTAST